MDNRSFYHRGSRELQDRFATRPLADRLVERTLHTTFTDADRRFIEASRMFFLATADDDGRPDCSYKGGDPGFVRVVEPAALAFPSYDGNGMYRSLGNLRVNARVGMLFIDFESQSRLRVNGRASLREDEASLALFPGAELVVHVAAAEIFPNCPRYIHQMKLVEPSAYVPRTGVDPPQPAWKSREEFRDVAPPPREDT